MQRTPLLSHRLEATGSRLSRGRGSPALFVQIAEQVEDSIVDGSLVEETQAPSTNELAAFCRINPATAAKGVQMLAGKGVLYKRRGVGMFVSPGARDLLLQERRRVFVDRYMQPLLTEARKIGLDADAVADLVRASARTGTTATASPAGGKDGTA